MNKWLDGHVGDLILWSVFVLCLTAHLIAVLVGKPDQTLAGAVLGSMGALGAYMQKRATTSTTTNVDTANIARMEAPKPTRLEGASRVGSSPEEGDGE